VPKRGPLHLRQVNPQLVDTMTKVRQSEMLKPPAFPAPARTCTCITGESRSSSHMYLHHRAFPLRLVHALVMPASARMYILTWHSRSESRHDRFLKRKKAAEADHMWAR